MKGCCGRVKTLGVQAGWKVEGVLRNQPVYLWLIKLEWELWKARNYKIYSSELSKGEPCKRHFERYVLILVLAVTDTRTPACQKVCISKCFHHFSDSHVDLKSFQWTSPGTVIQRY